MYDDTTTIEAYEALQYYFNHLTKTGYMRYDNVSRLLVFLFIDEMLHAYSDFDITEEDYTIINDVLQCLYGTCLLPYPEFKRNLPFVNKDMEPEYLRSAEWIQLRLTEDESPSLRIIESNVILAR